MALSSFPRSAIPQGRVRGPPPQLAGHQLRCPDATPMVGRETSRDTTDCLDQQHCRSVSSDPFHTTLGRLFSDSAPKGDIGALNESPSPDSVGERATPVGTPSAGWPAGPPPMEVLKGSDLTVAAFRSSAVNSQRDASNTQQLYKSTELGRTPDKALGVQEAAQNLDVPPLPLLAAATQPPAPAHLPQPDAAAGKPDNSTHASPSPGNGACRAGSGSEFSSPVEPPVGTPPDASLASPITDGAAAGAADAAAAVPVSAIDFLNSCVSFSSAFLGMISNNREHFQSIIDEVARRPWGPDGCFNFGSAVNMRMQALLDELCDTAPNYFDDWCEQLAKTMI